MSVLEGPRRELRRVVLHGRLHACEQVPEGLRLDDGRVIDAADAVHAPPVDVGTIYCVHLNYRSRALEFGRDLAGTEPTYFVKPRSTLNAHGGDLVRPVDCQLLNYEGEIAAVVGRPMRRVRPGDVWDHLAGFTCANDVGAHDFRDTDAGSMLRVKGQDGFCPLGPSLVRGVDVRRSVLRTYVNDQLMQEGAVEEMVWGIDVLCADLSRHITLQPGDVVLTGTPWHSRPIFPGDVVAVEVDGLGRLENRVVDGPAPDGPGFAATVTKTGLGVALGSDYRVLRRPGHVPTPDDYRQARVELSARNMATGPKPPPPRQGPDGGSQGKDPR